MTVDRHVLTAKRWAWLKPEPEQVYQAQRRIDLKPVKPGSRGLGNLSGVRIRGPGPWALLLVTKLPF